MPCIYLAGLENDSVKADVHLFSEHFMDII